MTGSDLLTKLVLLVYLYFARSYGNNLLVSEFLNLGIPPKKLDKALKYLVDEGYLVKELTLQLGDERLKKQMKVPSGVTDECKFIWQSDRDSLMWENALEQILKSLFSHRQGHAKSHSLSELDYFVMIGCLVIADEFRYFTLNPAEYIFESIGIDVEQCHCSFSKLIKSNLIHHVTDGFNASTFFGKLKSLYRIELRPFGLNTVSLIPEVERLRFRKSVKFLRLLELHKTALNKYEQLQVSKSKRARIPPQPPSNLLNMGISESNIHRLAAQTPTELFKAFHEIFKYAALISIRDNVKQYPLSQDEECDTVHLFQSVNDSISAVIGEILSYEEPITCKETKCSEATSLSIDEPGNCEVTECSEATLLSTDEPRNCEVTTCSEPMSLSNEEREYFRAFVISGLIAEAVDFGLQLAKQCQVFAKTNPGFNFNNCCFIETFRSVGFRVKEQDGEAQKTYSKTIDFVISGIIDYAQDESRPFIERIFDDGVLHEVVELKPSDSQAKGDKKAE